MTHTYVDGNALAGPLADLFAVDLTTAVLRCAGCGRTGPLAGLHVYQKAPGLVARCPGCQAVMVRLARTPTRVHLDLHGTLALAVSLPS
ncbi:DUF6510 family protein [Actinocatenispora rupis]|uniref:Uncharacterized protein n=1 Tax=Actinocatenispora rupis TaxID=519421 RepID=A0A8J3NCW4_9ACTN|nr:DUF6510 family protein [Actinocatenispora rupis]GID12320.1 hypothetical protein Aru02nite_32090 [Actinocatenispora rupis]